MQVTLPGDGESFAWMYSIEDPGGRSSISGAGAQVPRRPAAVGPMCSTAPIFRRPHPQLVAVCTAMHSTSSVIPGTACLIDQVCCSYLCVNLLAHAT